MDTDYELTRLHRLTNEEAELILDFRLLSAESKEGISYMCKSLADRYVEPTAGNVISIARRPAD